MIKLKLDKMAEKLGKTVTDIAEETGLNRNTVTALFHNNVDGIKFDTIEKICTTYKVDLNDIIEFQEEINPVIEKEPKKLYRQEAAAVPFTCWPWAIVANDLAKEFFKLGFGDFKLYFKESYAWLYWDHEALCQLARFVYERYGITGKWREIYQKFSEYTKQIENIYLEVDPVKLAGLSDEEILSYFKKLWDVCQNFWKHSVFIDSFDPGLDQEEIEKISQKYNFNKEDIGILTTPYQPTFNNERLLSLLMIIKPLFRKRIAKAKIKNFVATFVKNNSAIKDYMHEFDYYKSNYAFIRPISNEEVIEDIEKYLSDEMLFKTEFTRITKYQELQEAVIKKVLKKYNLKKNPLEFFNMLTYWREERKKINLMSIYVYHMILQVIEERKGIPKKYLHYLSFEEVEGALKGLITKQVLSERVNGTLISFQGTHYQMIVGNEAASIRDELEKKLAGDKEQKSFHGQTACQGYAKGIARIVLDEDDFHKLKDGEILVTGMTRPEFVPLMKIAAGIVTNEGGITCHAAIVSRELGKPCIIGTQKATQLIKDGDLVEVRANHGTVRILS